MKNKLAKFVGKRFAFVFVTAHSFGRTGVVERFVSDEELVVRFDGDEKGFITYPHYLYFQDHPRGYKQPCFAALGRC